MLRDIFMMSSFLRWQGDIYLRIDEWTSGSSVLDGCFASLKNRARLIHPGYDFVLPLLLQASGRLLNILCNLS